ncbi:Hypothetical predicted protein, partial [Paramuricea clavata]
MACCATMATLRSLLILVFLHQVGKSNANGPCSSKKYNITTLKNDRRNIAYNKTTNLCDRNLIKNGAWYKFESTAGNPQMLPEKNPGTGRCGTYIPIWMNGKHPTVDGVVTNVTACAQLLSVGSTCDTEYNIKVIKCKSFFIYELKPPSQCYLAYCATAATTPGGGRTTLSPATPPTTT